MVGWDVTLLHHVRNLGLHIEGYQFPNLPGTARGSCELERQGRRSPHGFTPRQRMGRMSSAVHRDVGGAGLGHWNLPQFITYVKTHQRRYLRTIHNMISSAGGQGQGTLGYMRSDIIGPIYLGAFLIWCCLTRPNLFDAVITAANSSHID